MTAYVGGGEFDEQGAPVLPNCKKDVLTITVEETEEIPDESTPSAGPSSSSTEEIPEESTPSAPATGGGSSSIWMMLALVLAAFLGATVLVLRRRAHCE